MEEGTWMEWRRKILVMPETVPQKSDCALDMQSNKKFLERKKNTLKRKKREKRADL